MDAGLPCASENAQVCMCCSSASMPTKVIHAVHIDFKKIKHGAIFFQSPARQPTNPRPDTTEEICRQVRRQHNNNLENVDFVVEEFRQLSMHEGPTDQVWLQSLVFVSCSIKFLLDRVFEKLFCNQNLINEQKALEIRFGEQRRERDIVEADVAKKRTCLQELQWSLERLRDEQKNMQDKIRMENIRCSELEKKLPK